MDLRLGPDWHAAPEGLERRKKEALQLALRAPKHGTVIPGATAWFRTASYLALLCP